MLLAQLLGLYFIIVGVIVLYRRKSLMPAISQLLNNRALLLVIALSELLAGLAIIIVYPNFTPDWVGAVSIIGWVLVVEGVLYLALPIKVVQRFVRKFNTDTWYGTGSIIAILVGAYIAAGGFGLI